MVVVASGGLILPNEKGVAPGVKENGLGAEPSSVVDAGLPKLKPVLGVDVVEAAFVDVLVVDFRPNEKLAVEEAAVVAAGLVSFVSSGFFRPKLNPFVLGDDSAPAAEAAVLAAKENVEDVAGLVLATENLNVSVPEVVAAVDFFSAVDAVSALDFSSSNSFKYLS